MAKQKMIRPKTIEEIVDMTTENDGELEPKAIIARVKYAEDFKKKKSSFGSGYYQDQQVRLESKEGESISGYNANPDIDFTEHVGQIVVVAVPDFNTRAAQIKIRQNDRYTNFNLGSKIEVWSVTDREILNESDEEDYDEREWRFDVPIGEGKSSKKRAQSDEEEEERPTRKSRKSSPTSDDEPPTKTWTKEPVPLSSIASKYSEAVAASQQIMTELGITDERAIVAGAGTIFIGYTNKNGITLDTMQLEEAADVEEASEPEEEEAVPEKKTRRRKKVEEPVEEEDSDEDEEEDNEEDEEERPKRRSSRAASKTTSKTSGTGRGSKKTTSRKR